LYNNSFQTLYQSRLKPGLSKLRSRHILVIVTGILTRILNVYFIAVVISLFLGFLKMFTADSFADTGFVKIISGFMYGVLGLVVLMIVNKTLKSQIGERNPALIKNNFLMIGLTIAISAVVIAVAYLIGTLYLNVEFGFAFFLRWSAAIFSVFVLILPYNLLKRVETNYIHDFRTIFLKESLPYINKEINYTEKKHLSRDEFESSKLFSFQNIWSYTGSDYFEGLQNNFHGSKLKVLQEETSSSKGKTETKITELFNGYLFVADFNKNFQGETFVMPDISRSLMGEVSGELMNEYIHRKNTQLVQLENPDFEKMFAVYSTDSVEARYILSTKLVERITTLKNTFYQDIYISFINNKMYVAIKSEDALFAPDIFTRVDDETFLEKQFNYLQSLLTIPEQFDLKTKIWN